MQFRTDLFLTALIAICVVSCSLPAPRPAMDSQEQSQMDRSMGVRLADSLEKRIPLIREVEISVYLRQLAEKLAKTVPELRDAPLGVLIMKDDQSKWRNLSLPGNRIYIHAGLLKMVEYESELAAAIALELGHIAQRHALRRYLESLPPSEEDDQSVDWTESAKPVEEVDFFGPNGIFSYTRQELIRSVEMTVDILYTAGVDPRGLTRLWNVFQSHPSNSPYGLQVLEELKSVTRKEIAARAPLRNPLVRSQNFLKMQSRLRNL